MNMNKFWLAGLLSMMPMLAFEQEAGGGGGDAGAGDPPAGGGDAPAAGEQESALAAALAANPSGEQDPQAEGDEAKTEGDDEPFKVEAPEGLEVFAADFEAYNAAVDGFLKDNPQASAKDALKWAAEYQAKLVGEQAASAEAEFKTNDANWRKAVETDPEIGGANLQKTYENVARAMNTFGGQGIFDVLHNTGLGSHPEVLRFLAKVGATAKESDIIAPTVGEGQAASFANKMYGKA